MSRVKALTLAALLVTLPAAALADTPPAPAPAPAASAAPAWLAPDPRPYTAPEPSRSGWRTLGAFALLLGIGGFALVARRKRAASSPLSEVPALRVLETARIGRDGQLVVAEVFGQVMLLGVTAQSIRRIATMPRPADFVAPEGANAPAEKRPPRSLAATLDEPQPFASALKSLLGAADGRRERAPREDAGNAAVSLAERTVDSIERRGSARPSAKREPEPPKASPIEGQAAGLRRRRS